MIGIIIQARMNSSRLPGKVLKNIGDKTLLEHIYYRLSYLTHQVRTVLATTTCKVDDAIVNYSMKNNFDCFRGNENNVLERYYLCAEKYGFSDIVRLTADNPFTDIEELDNLIKLHCDSKSDYSHSFRLLPIGVGAEIFTFQALKKSYINGRKPHHIEHVNEYMLENPELFKTIEFVSIGVDKKRPDIRLTVDTKTDYDRACFIVNNCKDRYITTEKAICLAERYNNF